MWIMISEYDFELLMFKPEYDRCNRVCIRRTGNRLSHAVGAIFYRGLDPLPPPPLAPAVYSVICLSARHDGKSCKKG